MAYSSFYSDEIMGHIKSPRNMGEMKNPDGVGTAGNPVCGDVMRLFIKVGKRLVPDGKKRSRKTQNSVPSAPSVPSVIKETSVTGNGQCAEGTEEFIEDVRFQTLGCGAAIATSSMATTMIKGNPLSEVEEISNKAVAEALGGLPPQKMHCSVLAADALKKAIEDYRKKKER